MSMKEAKIRSDSKHRQHLLFLKGPLEMCIRDSFLGEKVSKGAGAKHLQLEWLGGVILMVLAFIRLLG